MNNKVLIFLLSILLSGCAQIGNILIPAHPDSLSKPDLPNPSALILDNGSIECVPKAHLDVVSPDVVLKVFNAVLAADKKQYDTSFSATTSTCNFNDVELIKFKPTVKDGSPILDYEISLIKPGNAIVIEETKRDVKLLSNKVAAYPIATLLGKHNRHLLIGTWDQKIGNILGFINPVMMIHAIWGAFDESLYETDIVAKIKIAPIIHVNGENKFADI
jgi:hypothetical protein